MTTENQAPPKTTAEYFANARAALENGLADQVINGSSPPEQVAETPAVETAPAEVAPTAGVETTEEAPTPVVEAAPTSPAAPAPEPISRADYDRLVAQLGQQQAHMQQLVQLAMQRSMPAPQAPTPTAARPDPMADFIAPRHDPKLSDDENGVLWMRAWQAHSATKAKEEILSEVQRQVAPIQQVFAQQQAQARVDEYNRTLDSALEAAGYAKDSREWRAARKVVHAEAVGSHANRTPVTRESLAQWAAAVREDIPPPKKVQTVVAAKPAAPPLSAGGTVGAVPAKVGGEYKPAKNMKQASQNFLSDLKNKGMYLEEDA